MGSAIRSEMTILPGALSQSRRGRRRPRKPGSPASAPPKPPGFAPDRRPRRRYRPQEAADNSHHDKSAWARWLVWPCRGAPAIKTAQRTIQRRSERPTKPATSTPRHPNLQDGMVLAKRFYAPIPSIRHALYQILDRFVMPAARLVRLGARLTAQSRACCQTGFCRRRPAPRRRHPGRRPDRAGTVTVRGPVFSATIFLDLVPGGDAAPWRTSRRRPAGPSPPQRQWWWWYRWW